MVFHNENTQNGNNDEQVEISLTDGTVHSA